MNSPFDWNPDQTALCIKMHLAGATAASISRLFGITRNAVIGKLTRLKAAGTCPQLSDEVLLMKKFGQRITNANIARHRNVPKPVVKVPPPAKPVRKRSKTVFRVAPAPLPPKLTLVPSAPLAPVGDHAAPLRYVRKTGCRWIAEDFSHGQGDDAQMCGNRQEDGSAFCAHHRALALAPHTPTVRKNRWRGVVRQALFCADRSA